MSTTNSPTMAMKKSVIANYPVQNAIDYYKPLDFNFLDEDAIMLKKKIDDVKNEW